MNIERAYRKSGIRNRGQFTNPPFTALTDLNIVKDSIVHILPSNSGKDGPLSIEPFTFSLLQNKVSIFVDHVTEVNDPLGDPRYVPLNMRRKITDFHKKNRNFRILKRVNSVISNINSSILVNYSYLDSVYDYKKTRLNVYYKYANLVKGVNENIEKYSRLSKRPQFIELELPFTIRSLSEYRNLLSKNMNVIIGELGESEYWTITLLSFILDLAEDKFNLFRGNGSLYYYWSLGDSLVFLSHSKIVELKEEDPNVLARLFISFIDELVKKQVTEDEVESNLDVEIIDVSEPIENEINRATENMVNDGFITEMERERLLRLSKSYTEIPNPTGDGTLEKLLEPPTEDQISLDSNKLLESETILDKSMEQSSLENFDSKYVKELLQKDIARCVMNFQRAGLAVTDYAIVENKDAVTNSYTYKIQFTPIDGKPSTVEFTLPKVREDGTYMANNVTVRMDKQRSDMPIRKIKPNRVSLTSYFGKLFIDRDSKAVNDYGRWVTKKIMDLYDREDPVVKSLIAGNVFDSNFKSPRVYSAIAFRIEKFKYKNISFNFNHKTRNEYIGKYNLSKVEMGDRIVCGSVKNDPLLIDSENIFYVYTGDYEILGSLDDLLDNKLGKGPIEFATMVNMGKSISIGLVLGYKYGIKGLLRKLKANYRIDKEKRILVKEDEYAIRFADSSLIIKETDPEISMILNGFNMYKRDIVKYKLGDFDSKEVYLNVLDNYGMTIRYLKEIDLIFQMFIDPVTYELLKEMREPTSVDGLLLRAVELLTTDEHPRETDMAYMRVKGYERLSEMVYRELIRSLRGYQNSPEGKNRKLELHPKAIWLNVVNDPSMSQVNETNPIQNLREKEKISYSGLGGRDSKTMVRRTREFHPNDRGVISESSTDNNKVGVITYMTADPILKNLRGSVNKLTEKNGVSTQVSSTFLLSPSADRDEGKRVNFTGIQYAHTIAIAGNDIQPIRTGYESVVAHRSDSIYAGVAKQKGKVVEVTPAMLRVVYEDKSEERFKLGKTLAKTPGMNLIHIMITDRGVGYKFQANEVLCFNMGFFKRDVFDSKQVCFLMGAVSKVALAESTDTLEDSCAISKELSAKLSTKRTQLRNIIVTFEQSIRNLVKEGDEVEIDSPLCIIEDSITSENSLFDEESIQTLDLLSANVPKSEYRGTVERVEILYYGDIEDMSKNLASLAKKFDRVKKETVEAIGSDEVTTNKIGGWGVSAYHINDQKKLNKNSFVVRVYITNIETMDTGDKGVFANQLKTTVGRVMTGVNETESGIPIDAIFGFKSVANRVVLSPQINGTNTGALKLIGKKAAEIFFG